MQKHKRGGVETQQRGDVGPQEYGDAGTPERGVAGAPKGVGPQGRKIAQMQLRAILRGREDGGRGRRTMINSIITLPSV